MRLSKKVLCVYEEVIKDVYNRHFKCISKLNLNFIGLLLKSISNEVSKIKSQNDETSYKF